MASTLDPSGAFQNPAPLSKKDSHLENHWAKNSQRPLVISGPRDNFNGSISGLSMGLACLSKRAVIKALSIRVSCNITSGSRLEQNLGQKTGFYFYLGKQTNKQTNKTCFYHLYTLNKKNMFFLSFLNLFFATPRLLVGPRASSFAPGKSGEGADLVTSFSCLRRNR